MGRGYLHGIEEVYRSINGRFQYEKYERNGHLGRFLYRTLRFSEQYDWFSLSDYLVTEVNGFRKFMENNMLTNNLPEGEAQTKGDHNKESIAETKFAENGELQKAVEAVYDIGENAVYRQFLVGLFKDKEQEKSRIFTGGKSAIDLWTWNRSEFIVVELKRENQKVGIISEIFFYSNYMRDLLFTDGAFVLNKSKTKFDRGYSVVLNNSFDKICGIMLADVHHPLVNSETIAVLNSGKDTRIKYVMALYQNDLLEQGQNI